MNLQALVAKAIKKIDALSIDELEAGFRKYGYAPVRILNGDSYSVLMDAPSIPGACLIKMSPPISEAFNDDACFLCEAA